MDTNTAQNSQDPGVANSGVQVPSQNPSGWNGENTQIPQVRTILQKPDIVQARSASSLSDSSPNFDLEKDIQDLIQKINAVEKMPEELKEKALNMIERLRRGTRIGGFFNEFESTSKYIDWITQIPWGDFTKDNLDLKNAKDELDKTHYGLDKVKNLILEYLSVMKLRAEGDTSGVLSGDFENYTAIQERRYKAPVLLFVGLQGIGKTSIAKTIATALGRPLVRIALGAMPDVTIVRGNSRINLNAEPGQIVKALIRAKCMNPVIILDEIDKVSGSQEKRADMNAVLLEILDPEQNNRFMDYYLDHYIDLSNVFFIATANNLGTISIALLDRLEVIRFTSYTDTEKLVIAKSYLLPKVLNYTGLTENRLTVQEEVWPMIIRPLGYDSGIRQLERTIMGIARKAAKIMVEEKKDHVIITTENVKKFLPEDLGILG